MSEHERRSEVPPDPSGIEEPHDVLAAEEFGIGTGEERYPADPAGIEEPHDVLAADEFPIPAPDDGRKPTVAERAADPRAWLPLLLGIAIVLLVLRRRR